MTPDQPQLRVVAGGTPTDEQVAALVVALTTLRGGPETGEAARPRWNDRARALRGPLPVGVGWAWADRR